MDSAHMRRVRKEYEMAVTQEILDRISIIDIAEHAHAVDAFGVLGRDVMSIAIRQGIDLEDLINILHAYGFELGEEFGDERDDRGGVGRVAEAIVKSYVKKYYPGMLEGDPETEGMTLEKFICGLDYVGDRGDLPGEKKPQKKKKKGVHFLR